MWCLNNNVFVDITRIIIIVVPMMIISNRAKKHKEEGSLFDDKKKKKRWKRNYITVLNFFLVVLILVCVCGGGGDFFRIDFSLILFLERWGMSFVWIHAHYIYYSWICNTVFSEIESRAHMADQHNEKKGGGRMMARKIRQREKWGNKSQQPTLVLN